MTDHDILQGKSGLGEPGHPSAVAADDISTLVENIAPECGDFIPFPRLARALGVSLEALHRARLTGNTTKTADGGRTRVKIDGSFKLLGQFHVSRRALEAYLRRLNGEGGRDLEAAGPRTPTQRHRESERAGEKAAALGC